MNKRFIIPIVVVLLALLLVVKLMGGGNKIVLAWNAAPIPQVKIDSVELNVYVENSGSMDGYMCSGSQLKDAVFDYVSELKKNSSITSLYYVNSQIIPCEQSLEDYIQNLTPASFAQAGGNRANTDLRQILSMILQKQRKNTLTVFVSDCILDISGDALNFFGNCQISVRNSFIQALKKNPDLGVQIVKLQSKFEGYWYCGGNKELLSQVKRPYYIWVIGNKHLLAKVNKEAPFAQIIGGIDNQCGFSQPETVPFDVDKQTYVVNHANKINVEIMADLSRTLQPESVLTNANNYSVSHPSQVKVASVQRITAVGSKYTHLLNLELENPQSLNQETLTLNFPGIASWVVSSNDDTGQNVKQNLNKTTGLLYLVKGVSEAYRATEPFGEITFKINKR